MSKMMAAGSGDTDSSSDGKPVKRRDEDLAGEEHIREQAKDIFDLVDDAFQAQDERYDKNLDYWALYNSELGPNQFYHGNSQIFVPIVRNAVNARKTRFVNQLFPSSRRHIEAVSSDGTTISGLTALLEYYVKKAKLRTEIAPALVRNGDVEGQYSVYVSWQTQTRDVTWKTSAPMQHPVADPAMLMDDEDPLEGVSLGAPSDPDEPALDGEVIEDPDEEIEDMDNETITTGHPVVEVISDADIVVFPATADSIADALEEGGGVAVIRRWREGKIKQMARDGHINRKCAEALLGQLKAASEEGAEKDTSKKATNTAGVQTDDEGETFAVVYEVFTKIYLEEDDEDEDLEDEEATPKVCQLFLAGKEDKEILSVKRNPMWSDRVPILSAPVEKMTGVFKGMSQLKPVETLQYQANDAINEAMDSAAYALLPIIMTDPEKNPRVGSMILSLAAVWETSPKDTEFAKFPDMWKDGFTIVQACKSEIFETLSVSPARITQQASTKKLTQAEIANEQQVDMLNTSDAVTVLEDEIFTPLLSLFIELDHQFRDEEITVRSFGEMGLRANMQAIPPIQFDKRFQFTWCGVESSRNAQMIQQQISALNVVRTIPPQMYPGYQINMAPAISLLMETTFGPTLAPLIFKDMRSELSMDPEKENEYMGLELEMFVHPMDNHQEHMAAHAQELQRRVEEMGNGADPHGYFRTHLLKHQIALTLQAQAQQQAMVPSAGGGKGPQGPGSGSPRPGAAPGGKRPAQNPPGAIHGDRMADPTRMPPASLPAEGVR